MTSDAHELTREAREAWTAVAAGWERHADLIARSTGAIKSWLVDHADPKPGQTVLELAAGPGDTGFEIAKRLGPDGRLISTDISEAMIEAAQRRAKNFDVSNVEFRVMDAQNIELEDASVDTVVHRFGPMLLPDAPASVREVRRVLRDGGRYVASVWSAADKNPWILAMGMSLVFNGIEMKGDPNGPGGVFSLGEPDAFRSLVSSGGFSEVEVEAVDVFWDYEDADHAWVQASELSGPLSVAIAGLEHDMLAAVRSSYNEFLEQYKAGAGYHVPGQALCLLAR